jgi:uncharacterized protein (DUF2345 family)
MHSTTGLYRYLMALPSRTLTTRGEITYPDTATQAITSTHISSWRVTENTGDNLPIGGVGSASLELKLDNRDGEWLPGGSILGAHELDGATIDIELGVYDPNYLPSYPSVDGGTPSTTSGSYDGGAPDEVFTASLDGGDPWEFPTGGFQWSNIGTYVIESSIGQEQEPLLTIKGSDYLANYGSTLFTDGLTYPKTIIQILTEACSQASITLNTSSFTNSTTSIAVKPVWPDNTSCRDVISYVACVAGGFGFINRDGELEIVGFDDSSDYALTTARYKILETREDYGAFNSITAEAYDTRAEMRVEVAGGITDNEHNSILITGNPLIGSTEISSILAGMLSALGGLTFDSARIDWQGDPTVTLGDVLGVTDIGTDTYVVPVYKQTLNFNSGFGMSSENNIGSITRKASNLSKLFTSSGRLNSLALEGDIKIKSGENLYLESGGNMEIEAGGELTIASGASGGIEGNLNIESGANVNIKSGGDIEVESGGDINVASGGDIEIAPGGDINIASGGKLNLTSSDDMIVSSGTSLSLYVSDAADGVKVYYSSAAPASPFVGMMWLDSDDNLLRRCTSISPLTWVIVQADEVHTSYIDIADNSIDIKSTGEINVASGGALNISSGGSLNLSAASQITIGTKPMEVGGTNLLTDTDYETSAGNWSLNTVSTTQQLSSNTAMFGAKSLLIIRPANDADAGINISCSFVFGQVYTFSVWAYKDAGTYTIGCTAGTGTVAISDAGWKRYSLTFTATSASGYIYIASENSASNTAVYIERPKLETGNVATDWSPSPLDPAVGVKTSYITIDNDSIDIASGGMLNLSAASDIIIGTKPMEVGGANLLPDSGTHRAKATTGSGEVYIYTFSDINVKAGSTYTLSFDSAKETNCKSVQVNYIPNAGSVQYFNPTVTTGGTRYFWTFTVASGTTSCSLRFDNNGSSDGLSASAWIEKVKLEKGNVATDWSPSPLDPASGVKTSYITIGDDIDIASGGNINVKFGADIEVEGGGDINVASGGNINVASGGDIHVESGGDIEIASGGSLAIASGGDMTLSGATVDISTDLFEISNADGETLLEVSSASGGDPGGQLVLGSESMPIRIGGNFVLPVENGGTGSSVLTNRTHYFASYPDNSIGVDGDLGVLVNMASGTYAAISFTHYTTVSGNDTFCGLTRNWNSISPAGGTAVGNANATGTSNLYASAFSFSFTDPDTMDRIAINFNSAKYYSSTWYGWNVSSYITIAVCSSAGAVLGSTTFLPSTTGTLNSINIECSLEDDTTYYLIMYDNTTSATKSKCIIEIASVTSPAYAPAGYNCGIFVRHGGIWTLLASGSG